jgi:sugar-phosphatase
VERAWRAWAARWPVDIDAVLAVCHGRRTEDTIALFLPADQQPAAVGDLDELELADMDGVIALPGTQTLLKRLPDDRWAAVTSGPRPLMHARLKAAGLPAPAVLVSAEDVSVGKPDPQGYRRAAAALGYDITRCLVIEDAPAGLEAGRAAGAHVLAVATSHDSSELAALADGVIPTLEDCSVEFRGYGLVVTVPQL